MRGGGVGGTAQVKDHRREAKTAVAASLAAGRRPGRGRAAWPWQGGVRATRQGRANGRAACGRQSGERAARDEELEAEWRAECVRLPGRVADAEHKRKWWKMLRHFHLPLGLPDRFYDDFVFKPEGLLLPVINFSETVTANEFLDAGFAPWICPLGREGKNRPGENSADLPY